MAMNETSGQTHEAVQAFIKWTRSIEHPMGLGGPNFEPGQKFITQSSLEKYFSSGQPSQLEKLLDAVLDTSDRKVVSARIIKTHYLRCFATLLCIGAGSLIFILCRYESLQDGKMPFRIKPDDFPSLTPDRFKEFQEQQWQFCARQLEYGMDRRYRETDIIPIVWKQEIAQGGSAIVYKIVVHEDYNSLRPPDNTEADDHSQFKNKNTFVLKTYRGADAARTYETERDAHMKLRFNDLPQSSIIACYGGFAHEQSCHIVLEFADAGTLEYFMQNNEPPSVLEDIIKLWDRFARIAHGIMCIHGTRRDPNLPSLRLNGWHQDINPYNILVVSGQTDSIHDHHFKIGDLELAHFRTGNSSLDNLSDLDAFGTRAYGAPETFRSHQATETVPLQVDQKVDIWSLGCIISEILVWLHLRWPGVEEYRYQRSQEVKNKGGESGEELFHYDNKVLDIVRNTQEEFKQGIEAHHKINREIGGLVDDYMLTDGARADAKLVFEGIVRKIKSVRNQFGIPEPKMASNSDDESFETQPVRLSIRPLNHTHSVSNSRRAQPYPESRTRPKPSQSHPAGGEDDSDHRDSILASSPSSHLPASHEKTRVSREQSYRRHRVGASGNPNSADSPPGRVLDSPFQSPTAAHVRTASEQHQEQTCPETPIRPILTIDEGYVWRDKKKLGMNPVLNGKENLTALNGRDHIFLIDNSSTMKQHRENVARNVVLLAYMLKGSDEDGLDIYFHNSKDMINTKTSTRLRSDILKAPYGGCSDMRMRLIQVLTPYSTKVEKQPLLKKFFGLQSNPKAPRPLSLYVLTDGIWQPGNDVGGFIKNQAQQMKERGISRDKLAIQFIRFGDDPAGIEKLNILDNGLGLRAIGMDFVDHTFWNDNVWKQLLGATNDWYDDDPA